MRLDSGTLYTVTFEEKHDSPVYLVRGMSGMQKLALEKLGERVEQWDLPTSADEVHWSRDEQYWGKERMTLEEARKLAAMTQAELDVLPGKQYAVTEPKWRSAKYALREYDRAVEHAERIGKALRTNDGVLALEILEERKDGEYEGFDYERAGKIYE